MAQKIWIISYNIRKVDGSGYPAPNEMFKLDEMQVPQAIKNAAEKIADRFDFPYVEVKAKATEDAQTFRYVHQADSGFRDEWVVGKQ